MVTVKVVLVSNKGGTGKTTVATNVAAAAAKLNPDIRVLVVDADPNSRTTSYLAGPTAMPRKDMFDFFKDPDLQPEAVIVRSSIADNLLVAPNVRGREIQPKTEAPKVKMKLKIFNKYLEDHNISLVILDLPAGKAKEHLLLTWWSQNVYLVTRPPRNDLRAARDMVETLYAETEKWLGWQRDLVKGVVLNAVMSRGESKEARRYLRKHFSAPMVAEIPVSGKVEEAGNHDMPVVTYAPNDPTTKEYYNLARRLLGEGGWESTELTGESRVRQKGFLEKLWGKLNIPLR